MGMASTIQPYADAKNRPISIANMGGLGMGDELMLQMENTAIDRKRAQAAATAGVPKNAMGPMTMSALTGSYFG